MSRYIEADAVEKAICKRVYAVEVEDILAEMANAPTIDIVRCKECKFSARYVDDGHIECRLYSHPLRHDYHEMKPDDFCSYGERSEP